MRLNIVGGQLIFADFMNNVQVLMTRLNDFFMVSIQLITFVNVSRGNRSGQRGQNIRGLRNVPMHCIHYTPHLQASVIWATVNKVHVYLYVCRFDKIHTCLKVFTRIWVGIEHPGISKSNVGIQAVIAYIFRRLLSTPHLCH